MTLRLGSGTTRGTAIFTNDISGASGITASSEGANAGNSVLTLSGANNTFSGGVTLTQPKANLTLNINSATALGATAGTLTVGGSTVTINNTSAAAITLANNNELALNNGFTFTGTRDLNMGTGAVNLGNGTRTITTTAGTLTLGGVISNGGITKAGVGTLVLSGANNYTTATLVNVGLLNVTGSLTSAVTVASGAFLSGTGTTTGTLTLSAGSTIVGTTAGNSFRAATVGTTSAVNIVGNDGSGTIGSKTIGVVRYNTGTGPTTANFSTAGYHAGASVANVGTSGGETQLSYTSAARTWDSAAGT